MKHDMKFKFNTTSMAEQNLLRTNIKNSVTTMINHTSIYVF